MINILLVCNAGMSTSMLVKKMQVVAKDKGIESTIWAIPDVQLSEQWSKADVILLGPQVSFLKDKVNIITQKSKPLEVIPMMDYGKMNGEAVLNLALGLQKK